MYSDTHAWADRVAPDQTPQNTTSDQGLYCLPSNWQFCAPQQVVKILGQVGGVKSLSAKQNILRTTFVFVF